METEASHGPPEGQEETKTAAIWAENLETLPLATTESLFLKQQTLTSTDVTAKTYGDQSFSVAAPKLWNTAES